MHLIFQAGTLPAKDLVDNGKIPKKNLVDTGILANKIWWVYFFKLILPI